MSPDLAVIDYNGRRTFTISLMRIDLHTHTTASDGGLTPQDLLQRAAAKGVHMLSITDHDTIAAYQDIKTPVTALTLVPGIEFSTVWRHTGIHVLGLNVDLQSGALREGVARQKDARRQRAVYIAERLAKQGIPNALPGAAQIAGNGNIGRPHFAGHLVNIGAAQSIKHAFTKFLKSASCNNTTFWAALPQIIEWIRDAGGIAVLAHPLKYKITRTRLCAMLDDFIIAGGQGIEVISGRQPAQETKDLAAISAQKQLLASCGSDFHLPDQSWAEVGGCSPLPEGCLPVWEKF